MNASQPQSENNSEQELRKQIDGLVDDLGPGKDWCETCEHPRCLDIKKAFKKAIMLLAEGYSNQREVEAVEHAIVKIMSAKTEGLFDNGDLFIKRAPIEQAVIDLIGYEKFRAIKDALPVAAPQPLSPEQRGKL